jgi:type II secretory pathway component PulF
MFPTFRFIIRFIFLGIPLFLLAGVLIIFLYFFLWPFLFILIPLTVIFFVSLKVRRQRMVLALIQNALEAEMPIHEVLYAYAGTCWGPWYRAKLIRFADRIQAGHSIVETAMSVKGVLRYDTVGLIKLGGTQLPDKLFAQTSGNVQQNGMVLERSLFQFAWYYMYLPFLILPVLFYLVAIMPKMEMIFRDFDMALPAVTLFVIDLSEIFVVYSYLFMPLLSILFLVPIFYFNFRSGILPWRPLGVRRMLRQRDSVQFLRLFAAGLELKKPIEEIVTVYTQVVPSSYLCRLGKHFNEQVAKGTDWIESLRKMRWLSCGEASLLESAVQADHVAAVLREVADSKEQRQRTSDNVFIQMFAVLCVTVFGLFAAVFAVACFMPLTVLITTLTSL